MCFLPQSLGGKEYWSWSRNGQGVSSTGVTTLPCVDFFAPFPLALMEALWEAFSWTWGSGYGTGRNRGGLMSCFVSRPFESHKLRRKEPTFSSAQLTGVLQWELEPKFQVIILTNFSFLVNIFASGCCQGELAETRLDMGIPESPGQMLSWYYLSSTLSNISVS